MSKVKNRLPIFYVHVGTGEYVRNVIKRSEINNEEVYLLGDRANISFAKNWFDMEQFLDDRYYEFKKVYVHLSTNNEKFEFGAFKKFFAIYQFAKVHRIRQFMMLDSDCMAFKDLTELDFSSYDVGLSIPENDAPYYWTASCHSAYWTIEALDDFLNYLISAYKNNLGKLEEKWNYHLKNRAEGGICDMTLLYLWVMQNRNLRFCNTAYRIQGGVFDHNVASSQGCRTGEFVLNKLTKIKKIKIEKEIPYYMDEKGQWVETFVVHCQGFSKMYISDISNGKCSIYHLVRTRMKYYIKRLKEKIFHI